MGVNRFIDYANPMYWAKMLRKGGIPKRKPYSFTVKINDFDHGTEQYPNNARCDFGNRIPVVGAGTQTYSGVYDTAVKRDSLVFSFTSKCEKTTEGKVQGFDVSPESKWKIKTKDGIEYEGIIGDGDKTMGGLFSVTPSYMEYTYRTGFTITSCYDCFVFDGCTLEFSPVFCEIKNNQFSCFLTDKHEAIQLGEYSPNVRLGETGEWGKEILKYVEAKNNCFDINLKCSDYTKIDDIVGSEQTPHGQVRVLIGSTFSKKNEDGQIIDISQELKEGIYHIKLFFGAASERPEGYEDYHAIEGVNGEEPILIKCAFKYDTSKFATIKATSTDTGKGLVQINGGIQGDEVETYSIKDKKVTLKACPISTYTFEKWVNESTREEKTEQEFTIDVTEGMYGESITQWNAHFGAPGITFTIKKKNYYDASITMKKRDPETGAFDISLCEDYYDWSSALPSPYGADLRYGDRLQITMSCGNGFKNPKLYIGNQTIDYDAPYEFMLDETTADAQYSLELEDNYGVIFLENYPAEMMNQGVTLSAYKTKCNITSEYPTDDEKYNDMKEAQGRDWTELFTDETYWRTVAIPLADETGTDSRWWIKIVATPNTDAGGEIVAPYIVEWMDAVDPRSIGLGHQRIFNQFIDKNNKIIRLSCKLAPETDKNKYYKLTLKTNIAGETESKALIHHTSNSLLWMSLIENNPYVFGEIAQDYQIRFREVSSSFIHDEHGYDLNTENIATITCNPPIEGKWYSTTIDQQGSGVITFEAPFRTATVFEDVTIQFNYTQQAQTEETKEKLTDAIEALEKDYDDGKEDVIEETPVKDEPDTDEADVAEAVLATEPAEDKE